MASAEARREMAIERAQEVFDRSTASLADREERKAFNRAHAPISRLVIRSEPVATAVPHRPARIDKTTVLLESIGRALASSCAELRADFRVEIAVLREANEALVARVASLEGREANEAAIIDMRALRQVGTA
jgi:hypothetical protein